jgi:hypothetical protein
VRRQARQREQHPQSLHQPLQSANAVPQRHDFLSLGRNQIIPGCDFLIVGDSGSQKRRGTGCRGGCRR